MYLRTLLILFVLGTLMLFAAINWTAFVTPFKLSVVFTTVEAPLGLVLLGIVGLLTLMFLIYLVFLQSSSLLESRRQARELQNQREIAEQTEASRFSQLRSYLEAELQALARQNDNEQAALLAKLDALERGLRSTVEQSVNSLAAYLGEIDDKLEKASAGSS
ncbi:MAG TPA: LapA family protein [Candidatus Binatia bacterium]|nr:LapA family protein [Candidatus Binatia bacterium]